MNGVIETSTGDLLRKGYCDFENDGSFDSGSESYRTDVPEGAHVRRDTNESAQYDRWNGSTWEKVNQPAPVSSLEKLFLVQEKDTKGRRIKETWYATDNGDGTYDDKVEEVDYTYSGIKVATKTVKKFRTDGSEYDSEPWDFYANDKTKIILKKRGA